MNGHGGKGNDLLLLPVTVHNSISNIFSFKSLRSLLMYLAYLIYVFSNLLPLLFMFSFVILCVTAEVKSPLLFACHLVPLHNHPECAVITPPLKRVLDARLY